MVKLLAGEKTREFPQPPGTWESISNVPRRSKFWRIQVLIVPILKTDPQAEHV